MIVTIAAAGLAAHLGAAPAGDDTDNLVHQVRGGSCSHGYDIDIHGRCYPPTASAVPPSVSGRAAMPRIQALTDDAGAGVGTTLRSAVRY